MWSQSSFQWDIVSLAVELQQILYLCNKCTALGKPQLSAGFVIVKPCSML